MIINEPYEAYTMTLGFFLNNRIWELMLMTGVAYIPILVMVVKSITEAYQGGDDEGDRGSMALRYIEVGTIKIFVVMIFVMMPLGSPLTNQTVAYNNFTCNAEETEDMVYLRQAKSATNMHVVINDEGSVIDNGKSLVESISMGVGGATVRPPLLFELVQNYSTKATNAVASTIPCVTDITSVGLALGETKMKFIETDELFTNVIKQCYGPLLESAVHGNGRMTAEDVQDHYWIGAPHFVGGTLGNVGAGVYHDKRMDLTDNYYKSVIDRAYRNSTNKPSNYSNKKKWFDVNGDGKANPLCIDAYSLLENFVDVDYRAEIKELESSMIARSWTVLANMYSQWFSGDPEEPNSGRNIIMKRLTSANTNNEHNDFLATSDKYEQENAVLMSMPLLNDPKNALKAAGSSIAALSAMMDAVFIKLLANPTIAMVQCLVFAVSGIIILMSNYSFKIISGVLVTIFGLEFTYVIFEICDWMDDVMLTLMSSDYSSVSMASLSAKAAVYNAVYYSYMVLPLVWFGLIGTVGFMAGSMGASMNQGAKQAGSVAKSAAGKAAGGVSKAAVKSGAEKAKG